MILDRLSLGHIFYMGFYAWNSTVAEAHFGDRLSMEVKIQIAVANG